MTTITPICGCLSASAINATPERVGIAPRRQILPDDVGLLHRPTAHQRGGVVERDARFGGGEVHPPPRGQSEVPLVAPGLSQAGLLRGLVVDWLWKLREALLERLDQQLPPADEHRELRALAPVVEGRARLPL